MGRPLPDMDSLEVLRRLNADERGRGVPTILLGEDTDAELRVEAFRLGAADFITRPFQSPELVARVARHAEVHQLRVDLERKAAALRADRAEFDATRARALEQSEKARRSSDQRFVDIVNTTDGIVWEADAATFKFTFVSDKAVRLLGYPVAEWLEPGFWVNHLHPDDKSWAPAFCASCTGRLEPHDFEYRFIARDGRTVWLRDIVTVVAEGGVPRWLRGVMVDSTRQKRMEAELRDANRLITEAQRLAKLGGWRYEPATDTLRWTDEVYRIHGLDPMDAEITAREAAEFWHPDDLPTITRANQRALEGGEPYDLELRLRRRDGAVVWVRAMGRPLVDGGQTIGVAGNVADITERKAAEETIRSLAFYDDLTGLPNRRMLFERLRVAAHPKTRIFARPVGRRSRRPTGSPVQAFAAFPDLRCWRSPASFTR